MSAFARAHESGNMCALSAMRPSPHIAFRMCRDKAITFTKRVVTETLGYNVKVEVFGSQLTGELQCCFPPPHLTFPLS